MITEVRVRFFKRFVDETFPLADHLVLAGPNNSGKTTLLQAVSVWHLALSRWLERRGPESGSRASERTGVPVTRQDFTALPLRIVDHLWTDAKVGLAKAERRTGEKPGKPRVLTIEVRGMSPRGSWALPMEFRYANAELMYVKPAGDDLGSAQRASEEVVVVHVPPFSGIGHAETRHDRPFQDLLVGQGKAGDILRNLLLEIHGKDGGESWKVLCDRIRDLFGVELLAPRYAGTPYIVCEYEEHSKGRGRATLDVASAGSGLHQVLLILAFMHARPSTVLLLDEPDAHLHVVLQKQIFDMLRSIAGKMKCQLIVATHAEVLIDASSADRVLSFFQKPHLLPSDSAKDQVTAALRRLPTTDLLAAERTSGVLYVEGESDFNLLRSWADVLKHDSRKWFHENPFWHANQGRNPREAKEHFFALSAIRADMRGLLLLDGDNRGLPDRELRADGLVLLRWNRYEAESYLLHPVAISRFIEAELGSLFADRAMEYLHDEVPPAFLRNPLGDHQFLVRTPASKTLLPGLFKSAGVVLTKSEYFRLAESMLPGEIPEEVKAKLDEIARVVEGGG